MCWPSVCRAFGKSHALCRRARVGRGRCRNFCATRDLLRALRKLPLQLFEVMRLDGLGYVQQSPDETEVVNTLLAEHYERRSGMVTSNLVFPRQQEAHRPAAFS